MFWIIFKYALKLIVVVAPLACVPYVAKHCHDSAVLAFILGPSPERSTIERFVAAIFASVSIMVMTVYESIMHLWPRTQVRNFAEAYVKNALDDFEEEIAESGLRMATDLRVNVLFARWHRFVWFANRGFTGCHHDNNLWILRWFGLSGNALKEKNTIAVDLRGRTPSGGRWPRRENLWLFSWQARKTRHLKAVVSIPIFKETKKGAMTHHKAVGVINVDAVSDAGAEWILSNGPALEAFFGDRGTALVWLSVG